MTARPAPHRFSVTLYEKMIDNGILREDDRVELIRGEIVAKMPIGKQHAACVKRLNRLFNSLLGAQAVVSVQDPIQFADSEPEPDIALLVPKGDYYASDKPAPADVLLIVEVADTSLEYDREAKGAVYAEAGIAEYWIVNLVDTCVEVYRQPRADGTYADVRTVRSGDTIQLFALPSVGVAVGEIV
jgi:Uma2 family endonuclease